MKIITGMSQGKIRELHEKATKSVPSQYSFTISVDEDKYNATIYCYVVYDEDNRNTMTGELEYNKSSKKTINKIVIDKFNDLEKIIKLSGSRIFKVDNEDYYLGDLEKNNQITLIAMNTNVF